MIKVELTCEACGTKFERQESEAKRNAAKGMRIFCSRKCRGKRIVQDTPLHRRVNSANLPKKQLDEFSPFRPHMKAIRSHASKIGKVVQISEVDLKALWELQNGVCPITGWEMLNYKHTHDRPVRCPERASVDRIDSSRDYTLDNVRFICMMAQFAKNTFSDEDVYRFCKSVHDIRQMSL